MRSEDQGQIPVVGPTEDLGSQPTVHVEAAALLSTAGEAWGPAAGGGRRQEAGA